MKIFVRFSLLAALLLGCPKRPVTVPGTSDEQRVDEAAARLEELRVRVQTREPSCSEGCGLAREACELSAQTCDVAARNAERSDFKTRCVASQEDCANFNDNCARCK